MNRNFEIKVLSHLPGKSKGMTLLDVVLAIVIFVVGMLALASLQGNLTRSSSDANVRTVASNIAEELIEGLRNVEEVHLVAGNTCETDLLAITGQNIFQCITDSTDSLSRGGADFSLTATVEDFYLMEDGVSVTKDVGDLPTSWNVTAPTYKFVNLTVNWANNAVAFQGADSDNQLLGSGEVSVSTVIPSIPNLGPAKIAAGHGDVANVPLIDYTPGARPDIIPIELIDGLRFKESETPMPEVIVRDEIVETWFDVVTYNQTDSATFIRREEFAIVSCDCELQAATGGKDGFLPVTWNGEEYVEQEMVSKPFGISASPQQSQYCDTCCRDHHDEPGNTGDDNVYDPWRDWTAPSTGVHAHYYPRKQGGFDTITTPGKDYLEVCRMVRKDGFMRVAQDFRQEGVVATSQSFFYDSANVNNYSDYVIAAVTDVLNDSPQKSRVLPTPFDLGLALPGDAKYDTVSGTNINLPTAVGAMQDQQVSRGIYVDHITQDLADAISCVRTGLPTGCVPPVGVDSYLEILPFYEIQTTWLAHWSEVNEVPNISVTSERLSDFNTHSRGMVTSTGDDATDIRSKIHRGNIGLTATDAIDPMYSQGEHWYDMPAISGTGGTPVPTGPEFSGSLRSVVGGVKAALTTMFGTDGVTCNKTADDFKCLLSLTPTDPTVTITGYSKSNTTLYVCSATAGVTVLNAHDPNSATIKLIGLSANLTDVDLVIQQDACT